MTDERERILAAGLRSVRTSIDAYLVRLRSESALSSGMSPFLVLGAIGKDVERALDEAGES